ncbi:MAG: fasciclin domain-containing protein [Bacteroidota bacterium]
MNTFRLFLAFLMISLTFGSCKNETETKETPSSAVTKDTSEETKKTEEAQVQKKVANSLMAKLMVTPETKTFMSNAVSAGITDILSKNEGPYTLVVPSNEAFEALPDLTKDQMANPQHKESLATILKNHIVEEDLTSAALLQSLRTNKVRTLKTMGGADLMVYLEGSDIVFKDSKGVIGKLGKSDILASNGKVHIIDAVLTTK